MIGIIVQLVISWLLLWLFEKKDLGPLGFYPTKQRLRHFVLFFIVTACCASLGFLMRMYFGERWVFNPLFTWKLLAAGIWYNVKSVLYEELIFRGAIFYILIKRVGVIKATVISAIAFGIYHWFSFEIIGNPGQMVLVFFVTGVAGLLYCFAYTKTLSLFTPIGIHFGWNFTQNFFFSAGNIGNGVLIAAKPAYTTTVSWPVYLGIVYLPTMAMLIINYFLLRRIKPQELI